MKAKIFLFMFGLFNIICYNHFVVAQQNDITKDNLVGMLVPDSTIVHEIDPGETQSLGIDLSQGEFLEASVEQLGIDLMVTLFDADGNKFNNIDGREISESPETFSFQTATSGIYRIDIKSLEMNSAPGFYRARILQKFSQEEYLKNLEDESRFTKEWLDKNAIKIKTVEPGNDFEDLQPLKKLFGDCRIVAIGEATHGTREFFQMSHRLLEFLVEEMGFTVFGTESELPEGFDINKYILDGIGDPYKFLAGLDAPLKNTEEFIQMIQWMHEYNADSSHHKKIKWYGIDTQKTLRPVRNVINYLNKVEPGQASSVTEKLDFLGNPYLEFDNLRFSGERAKELLKIIDDLSDYFDNNKDKFIDTSSDSEWKIARQNVKILGNIILIRSSSPYKPVRDSIMAENVRWILENEEPDSKMMLWAHNGHVTNSFLSVGSMGWHLRKLYGNDLVTIGAAFNEGSFIAREMASDAGIHSFTVNPSIDGTLDATLADVGLKIAVIDFHNIPKEGPVFDWFNKTHEQRIISGVYTDRYAKEFLNSGYPQSFPDQYDALFFVENTTATRLLLDEGQTKVQVLSSPHNGDFENGKVGESPPDWILPSMNSTFDFQHLLREKLSAIDFEYITSSEDPYNGKQCFCINKSLGQNYGETYGWIRQVIDASQFKNKKLTLSAAVRIKPNKTNDKAYLWLRIMKSGTGSSGWLFFEKMADNPITGIEWKTYEITGAVSEDAESIEFGLSFVGDGAAYFDAVSLIARDN